MAAVSQNGPFLIKNHVRAGVYDFEKGTSLAHDGSFLTQKCDYRHAFTAKFALPIDLQHFIEAYQMYDPTIVQESDYWLPNALNSSTYAIVRRTKVDDLPCIVVANAYDEMSIAASHGYVVLRRKFRRREFNRLETFRAQDVREVVSGVWIPFAQARITRQIKPDSSVQQEPLTTEILRVSNVTTGKLKTEDLEVDIPADVMEFEDDINDVNVQRNDEAMIGSALGRLQEEARHDVRVRWTRIALFGILAVGLTTWTFVLRQRPA